MAMLHDHSESWYVCGVFTPCHMFCAEILTSFAERYKYLVMQLLNIDISQRAQGPASHIEIIDLMQLTELCFIYNLEVGQIFKCVCDVYHLLFGEVL
jgi:hypothetical protein